MFKILQFGMIPENDESSLISLGDLSDTKITEHSIDIAFGGWDDEELTEPNSSFWKNIASTLQNDCSKYQQQITSDQVFWVWECLHNDRELGPQMLLIAADDEDGAEFQNDDGRHSGKLYMRLVTEAEEDSEIEEVHDWTILFAAVSATDV